ncbi:MAG TPA: c-type cytochrome [Gemmatimonadales bacterium]|nr:c-type cytochrome [Gemmatimonadales bacterium]
MRPTPLGPTFALAATLLLTGRAALAQAAKPAPPGAAPDSSLLTPATIDAGRKLFHGRGSCFACHGDKLQGGPIAPPLTGASWRHITGTYDAIINRIDNGLPGTAMVAHPGGISEAQVVLVGTYVYAVSHHLAPP